MRVYLPLTLPALREAHGAGEVGPAPLTAYAVTPALREWLGSEDEEELEYTALGLAAHASLRLLAQQPEAPRRRVVVVAEVADRQVDEGAGHGGDGGDDEGAAGRVRVAAAVPFKKVAAVHVDAEDAVEAVTAAAAAWDAADGGEEEALAVVDAAGEHDLLWYATQEVPELLGR
ncbi:DUF6912 family protein [Streptomyces sp. NRRL F-5053]|uniref:DUF6912 family protein n=1 Tax=Streptomyces sp. NRRL F-5053 TaxID=1463854 RepID=UPI0004C7EA30|nr:hypothetical protein [Streptomyces sp. NRRL F-5053]